MSEETIEVKTRDEVFDELVDLVCEVVQRYGNEPLRRRAQALLVEDHGRRLAARGLHPRTGEPVT